MSFSTSHTFLIPTLKNLRGFHLIMYWIRVSKLWKYLYRLFIEGNASVKSNSALCPWKKKATVLVTSWTEDNYS